jgi:multiple sugar transport system substrate-binding protein
MLRNRLGAVAVLAVGALAIAAGTSAATHRTHADAGNVVFLSTQLNSITESEGFRNQILKGFPGSVDKIDIPLGNTTFFPDRIKAEADAGKGTVSLLGGVHGDYPPMVQYLTDLSDVAKDLQKAGIPPELFTLGKLGTNKQYYIPWMQATYIMVANKKALTDLPKGANVNSLTYGQLFQWAKALQAHYGKPVLGFPAGPTGLFYRFLQGYLVPGFSGHLNTSFKSKWAISGWLYMKQLWQYVHPQSLTYNFMQDPLQSGEVMVAWDHVARITSAVRDHPNDYVAFPAPAGPQGRAYLPVLAGLAIPKTAPNVAGAKQLIEYLDGIAPQARLPQVAGFFPVVGQRLSKQVGPGLLAIAAAVKTQQRSKDALASLLPVGLGAQGGNYNRVFIDTFTRIVVNKEDVNKVIDDEAQKLQEVLNTAAAPCWKPDPASTGTCQVGAANP